VPRNDPTLMFTNSGMVQFKNLFTGVEHRDYKCARPPRRNACAPAASTTTWTTSATPRGITPSSRCWAISASATISRNDAIPFAWELLTKDFGIDKSKLLVTVYHTDDEAAEIWKKVAGLPDDRIIRIATNDNFWMMGPTGPCGPCTEIFYDHGDDIWGGPPGSPEEDGDRFIEIWNLVFMQFEQFEDGSQALRSTCSRSTPAWGWNGSARCCRASTTITTPT
jgi:alanyl-tRNA synthetase